MQDDKYVVFKLEGGDFWRAIGVLIGVPPESIPHIFDSFAVHDGVVIRRQDHFAPAALHTYASSINMAIKGLQEASNALDGFPDTSPEINKIVERLRGIADYFHEQAVAAEAEAWKLPD